MLRLKIDELKAEIESAMYNSDLEGASDRLAFLESQLRLATVIEQEVTRRVNEIVPDIMRSFSKTLTEKVFEVVDTMVMVPNPEDVLEALADSLNSI